MSEAPRRGIALRLVGALVLGVAVTAPVLATAGAAHAAAYRYWTYWLGSDSGWTFASVGPAFRVPADGTVEGWRFAVTGVQGNQPPAFAVDFDAVCADTEPVDGRKRVAVVVDPGTAADAPEGEQPPGAWAMCVVAQSGATGYDVLRAAATVRTDKGIVCAIGGYPSRGCAEVTSDPSPRPSSTARPRPSASTTPGGPGATETPGDSSGAQTGGSGGGDSAGAATDTSTVPSAAAGSAKASPSATASARAASDAPSATSAPPAEPVPTPSPTLSVITAPMTDPPSSGGGTAGMIAGGIAVAGIAVLGGAAIVRMRRAT